MDGHVVESQLPPELLIPHEPPRRLRRLSFILCVVLPSALVLAYFLFIAAPQYVTEFRFTVYSAGAPSQSSQHGIGSNNDIQATGQAPSQSMLANYIVLDYLQSRQIIQDLTGRLNLAAIYQRPNSDPLIRFWWDNGSVERLLRYWNNFVINVNFDVTTGLAQVEVRAFTPEDSLTVARLLVELSERLVNDLMERPRANAVRYAEAAVDHAEQRLHRALSAEQDFRNAQRSSNPGRSADQVLALLAVLDQNIAEQTAQLESLRRQLASTAPAINMLRRQISATKAERDSVATKIGAGEAEAGSDAVARGGAGLAVALSTYEYLEQERTFAATFYNAMLQAVEQARFDAGVQHSYLQTYVQPSLPGYALYPKPFLWGFLTFVTLATLWAIFTLFYYSMRDHVT